MAHASVVEVFVSVQGEGTRVGQRHIFVRFLGCDLRCSYCDTTAARAEDKSDDSRNLCRIQKSPRTFEYEQAKNPVAAADLSRFCSRLIVPGMSRPIVSLTGGEPLIQTAFLLEWLPLARKDFIFYLETCGVHHEEMNAIREYVDVVSMDMKLPSATGLRPYWREHRRFLEAASGREVFIKAVVTKDATLEDLKVAAALIAEVDPSIPLILQPASGPLAPPIRKLLTMQDAILEMIRDVRIIPQVHRMLNVP